MPSPLRPVTVTASLLAGLALAACSKSETKAPTAAATPAPAAAPANAPAPAQAVPEPVRKMLGRWMRADGGYVLELRNAEMSGVVEAAYFNPKPIKVSRAVWMRGGEGLQVAVELNDVGYPGAMYVLTHDTQNDRLVGQYTQPAMQ